ncbi:alpha/beta hydrolase [Leptospira wolffii]|uniref:alpha/beta fold hydrolase n=1 Tax=Leptospira wolffii TaxID=409998 RepID=UPI0010829744|nr:alpha/beta hydrolase [Leptospira wolffii]TGL48971.1 alpha/beta hydrolase [Leptospira wolffii]
MKRRLFPIGIAGLVLVISILPFLRSFEDSELNEAARASAKGSFVTLTRGTVHYELAGPEKGKLVVLVHGFSTPYYIWDPVVESLLHSGYKVLRFDLYGRGYSDRPDTVYNMDLFVSQIEDLLNSLHIQDSFDIMGLSMGGPIVAAYTGKNPSRVKKVVLVDPFSQTTSIFPLNLPWIGEYLNTTVYIPSLPKGISKDFVDPSKVPNGWVEGYRKQMSFIGFRRAILSTLRNLIIRDPKVHFESLALAKKPVLMFWGEEDKTTPLESGAYLRELLKPEFVLVKRAGHLPHVEKPEEVLPVISLFLK